MITTHSNCNHLFCLTLLMHLISVVITGGGPGYDSGYVFVDIKNVRNEAVRTVCANYQQWRSHQIAESAEAAMPLKLAFWGDRNKNYDNCELAEDRNLSMHIVPSFYRLNISKIEDCPNVPTSITDGGWKKQFPYVVHRINSKNASAALFLVKRGYHYYQQFNDFLFADFRDPYMSEFKMYSTDIPVFYTYVATFEDKILSMSEKVDASDLELMFYRPHAFEIDGAMAIILFLSVFCIAVGGWWSGKHRCILWWDEVEKEKRKNVKDADANPEIDVEGENGPDRLAAGMSSKSQNEEEQEPAAAPFGWITLIMFVVVIVGVLMLLYYFYNIFVWFIIVMFTVASCLAAHSCLSALLDPVPCGKCRICWSLADCYRRVFGKELRGGCGCCREKPMLRNIMLFICCAAFAICWCVFRKWPFAFILQDILSVFFCIHLIKSLRIPNLKWLTILLGALLVYDVFMVFITPFMTKDGCSIMVEVATGGGCDQGTNDFPSPPQYREQLPIIFRVPRVTDPVLQCYDVAVDLQYPPMMLGLGDVILPGLLIGFCFAIDFIWKIKYHLFGLVGVCSYGIGMVITFAALMLMKRAQPALIYLVPLTLLPVILTAKLKNMLGILWRGDMPRSKEEMTKVTGGEGYVAASGVHRYESANETDAGTNDIETSGSHPVTVTAGF